MANCKICKHAWETKRIASVWCVATGEQRIMFGSAGYMYMNEQPEWNPPEDFCNGKFEEGENNVLCGRESIKSLFAR